METKSLTLNANRTGTLIAASLAGVHVDFIAKFDIDALLVSRPDATKLMGVSTLAKQSSLRL